MNDRLLKESDVLRAIDKRIEVLSKDPEFVRKNGIIDVIGVKKYILAIPSADKSQEWIPCSERLPEAGVSVIVTSKSGYVYISNIAHGEWEYGGDVIAWMPLPEPWKGADDEH